MATASRKDWIKFIIVMLIFLTGAVIMMVKQIHDPWIWTAYIIVWTWLEMVIAKNIHLKWYVWLLIILGISGIDLIIIQLLG